MDKFRITMGWLAEKMTMAEGASQVTLPGEEMRAILRAAWVGMGYPPSAANEVFDFVPAKNPNWLRYHRERKPEGTERAKPNLRVVADNAEDKES